MKQNHKMLSCIGFLGAATCAVGTSAQGQGATIAFDISAFELSPVFNTLSITDFAIELAGPIVAGQSAENPALNGVEYRIFGTLSSPTPSNFPAFDLNRTIGGTEFYDQGSSLSFTVSPTADLSDGLQVSELTSSDPSVPVFVFNAREVDTARFHPTLLEIFADGTGVIQNANNSGGVNPFNNVLVDVDFGEEYIVNLAFDPEAFTLIAADAIPEPASLAMVGLGGLALLSRQRRK